MVRTYKPKTDRKNINEENIEDAICEVLSKTLSICKAADKYGIKTATLQHRIEKARKSFEATRTLSTNEVPLHYKQNLLYHKQAHLHQK